MLKLICYFHLGCRAYTQVWGIRR